MKENKKELLDRIKKLYRKGGRAGTSALVMALQKVDADSLAVEKDGVYSTDHTRLIYSRGDEAVVTVPADVLVIGDMAFAGKKGLTRVLLPAGLREIGAEAFADCDALTEVTIPASVESVGDYAFSDCDRLRRVVFMGMPRRLTRKVFESCDDLHDIVVAQHCVKAMRKALHIDDGDIEGLVTGWGGATTR